MTKPVTKSVTKTVTKPVTKSVTKLNHIFTILDKITKNGQCVVSVSVTVSAKIIGQFEFRFRYWTETEIVVSVGH